MKTQMVGVALQEEDRQAYRNQGFWIGPQLFDDTTVEELRDAVYRTIRGERDFDSMHWGQPPKFDPQSPKLAHVVNGWWVNAKIRELIRSDEIGYLASQLMGTQEVRLVHDQILYKPGSGSESEEVPDGNVGWHQDAAHWTMFNSTTFCTAWIALQDTDLSNGSMCFVEGSHKWGLIKAAAGFANKDLHASEKKFSQSDRRWVEIPCVLKAGQVSFHTGLTFHGSGPNRTEAPRLSIALNMMPGGTTYNSNGRDNLIGAQLGPYVKHGDPCTDPFFPRIWPPQTELIN